MNKKTTKRRNVSLSYKDKLKMIQCFKNKIKTKAELVNQYKCDISTINRILRNELKITELPIKNIRRKRLREGANKNVENALSKWFDQIRAQNGLITTAILLEKAKEFATKFNSNFQPSSGWLCRWQKRENIMRKGIHGESASADVIAAQEYINSVLPPILEKYSAANVFNADESGLFYKALPTHTLSRKGECIRGGKIGKERLTILLICNVVGNYKKIYVIGKSKNPRCFKNKVLPIQYFCNKNAWMTTEIWNSILQKLDLQMIKEKRKIVILADNAACHKITSQFKMIEVKFLPPNTTSIIQPLDAGIIHSFKSAYRKIILRKQILALQNNVDIKTFLKSTNLFDVINYVDYAWKQVNENTIINCFKKVTTYYMYT